MERGAVTLDPRTRVAAVLEGVSHRHRSTSSTLAGFPYPNMAATRSSVLHSRCQYCSARATPLRRPTARVQPGIHESRKKPPETARLGMEEEVGTVHWAPLDSQAALEPSLLPEWLQRRQEERQLNAERRLLEKAGREVEEEKDDSYYVAFEQEREALQRLLQAGAPGEEAPEAALQEAGARLQALQQLLNDSLRFLPAYRVKTSQEALQQLGVALAQLRERLQPKKKFAFKSRGRKEGPAAPHPPDATPEPAPKLPGDAQVSAEPPEPSCGFHGLVAQSLELRGEALHGRDVQLSELRECRVRLLGCPGSLRLRGLRGCTVLCGPVASSVFVDECRDCELAFPCQQLRVHRSSDTRVYLHVTCRAIIEDCLGLRFAPLRWSYEGMKEDYQRSGLDRARNYWSQVDDFNWLARGVASPNWSVLPEEERRESWD